MVLTNLGAGGEIRIRQDREVGETRVEAQSNAIWPDKWEKVIEAESRMAKFLDDCAKGNDESTPLEEDVCSVMRQILDWKPGKSLLSRAQLRTTIFVNHYLSVQNSRCMPLEITPLFSSTATGEFTISSRTSILNRKTSSHTKRHLRKTFGNSVSTSIGVFDLLWLSAPVIVQYTTPISALQTDYSARFQAPSPRETAKPPTSSNR